MSGAIHWEQHVDLDQGRKSSNMGSNYAFITAVSVRKNFSCEMGGVYH